MSNMYYYCGGSYSGGYCVRVTTNVCCGASWRHWHLLASTCAMIFNWHDDCVSVTTIDKHIPTVLINNLDVWRLWQPVLVTVFCHYQEVWCDCCMTTWRQWPDYGLWGGQWRLMPGHAICPSCMANMTSTPNQLLHTGHTFLTIQCDPGNDLAILVFSVCVVPLWTCMQWHWANDL